MHRKELSTAALIVGVVVCAMAVLASSSWASTPRRYILRHPKREHCKAHYRRKVVTVKKRVHGHNKKVRVTVCVRLPRKPAPSALSPQPETPAPIFVPLPIPASPPGRQPRERVPREPKPPPKPTGPSCTSTFTGAEDDTWGTAANWTTGVPSGFSSYGCIPSGYPNTVIFGTNAETPAEIGGVSAENSEGITLQGGHLTLANPEQKSLINNVRPGGTAVTLDEGVILELTGTIGELGGNAWNGAGTLEIPRGAYLRTGDCARWAGARGNICVDGTPTPGHGGLQVKNFGTIWGAGISLCRNGAAKPAKVENEWLIQIKNSGEFGGASECGEVGSVVNGKRGLIGIAQLDGAGCNVRVGIASLRNQGVVKLGSCGRTETEQQQRPKLEIGSSLSEVGTIETAGIVHIQGDYTPTDSSNLIVDIRSTFPQGSPQTDYGTIRVSGNAALAGELNIETERWESLPPPPLGETFQIVEVAGSLTGKFTLGNHCIPTEPGNGYKVDYKSGSKGTVTLEVAKVAGC
jgi:hypothetical protein